MNRAYQIPARRTRGSGPSAPAQQAPQPPQRARPNRRLCRTTEYTPPGSRLQGLSPTNQPSKVVWELDYSLTEEQFAKLSARFPGIAFVQTGFDCHDHPIAHTSYRVVWENVLRKLKPGVKVADIAGNPAVNENFNKSQATRDNPIVIDTFCKVQSPKDSIRAKTRWGPPVVDGKTRWEEYTLNDMYRNAENAKRFSGYDVFLMNHVLYYYTFAEVNRLLSLNPGSVLYATIHKLDGQAGHINCKEQSYEKDLLTGRVTQTNVETGEVYEHPDPAPWFRKFSYADAHGAFTWTINKGCEDTYVITATSTEPKLVPESCWSGGRIYLRNEEEVVETRVPVPADPPPAYSREVVTFKTHDLLPGYHVNKVKQVTITHPDLYDTLQKFMINKPRNSRTLVDLTSKAFRETGMNPLCGGKSKVDISSKGITEHVFAAWMSGLDVEAELFGAAVMSSPNLGVVNRNLAGRTLHFGPGNSAKQALRAAMSFATVMRSKEPMQEVLCQIDELL